MIFDFAIEQIYKKNSYLPCPLYFFGLAAFGPNFFFALPVLLAPKEILPTLAFDFVLLAIIMFIYKYGVIKKGTVANCPF
jgi:hypothetical protein